jgi:AcrR family transcriptional regulator
MHDKRRLTRDERRTQIIDVALSTVAEHGVRGATLTRVAAGVGITYPALYAHFANRREMLLAVIDELFHRIQETNSASFRSNAIDHLRAIAHAHSQLVASAEAGYVLPFFEFVAAAPEENLREELGNREMQLVDRLADIVKRGQREGSIIEQADPEQIAWMIQSRAWTEDIAALMGLRHHWTMDRANRMLEFVLKSIAVPEHSQDVNPQ